MPRTTNETIAADFNHLAALTTVKAAALGREPKLYYLGHSKEADGRFREIRIDFDAREDFAHLAAQVTGLSDDYTLRFLDSAISSLTRVAEGTEPEGVSP